MNSTLGSVVPLAMFKLIRPTPAFGQQGLDWIVRPEYRFGVFSMYRFAHTALSTLPFKEVIIFRDTQTNSPFSSFTGGPY